jgi:hypothetical protein
MATNRALCRRNFLRGAGAGLLSLMAPQAAFALERSDGVFISAAMKRDGSHAVVVLTERGQIVWEAPLPGRGHGFAVHAETGRLVAFARRPGSFALAFEGREGEPMAFATPQGRHFHGHGLFANGGKLLLTTENDFEDERGMIGVWDATARFSRVGEFPSHGLDPHDMVLLPDGRTLCVANGGILTRPETGRAKLNLDSMRPSIAFIDIGDGRLVAQMEPPSQLYRLSLRHLACGSDGRVWFGAQWEGSDMETPPLIGHASPGGGIAFASLDGETLGKLRNYVGSVAANADGSRIAFTSPEGGHAVILDSASGKVAGIVGQKGVCGVAGLGAGFLYSSESGQVAGIRHPVAWDNHMRPLQA